MGWEERAPLPAPRYSFGVATLLDLIHVVAGAGPIPAGGTEPQGDHWSYDALADGWTPQTPLPGGLVLYELAALAMNGHLYINGGATQEGTAFATTTHKLWNPASPLAWVDRTVLPVKRRQHAAANRGGEYYTIGGTSVSVQDGQVRRYNSATEAWGPTTPASSQYPLAIQFHSAATWPVAPFDIHVFGGLATGVSTLHYKRVDATNSWVLRAALPAARYGMGIAVTSAGIWLTGGRDASHQATKTVWLYDPVTDTYDTSYPDLPYERFYLRAAAVGDRVFAIGGVGRFPAEAEWQTGRCALSASPAEIARAEVWELV